MVLRVFIFNYQKAVDFSFWKSITKACKHMCKEILIFAITEIEHKESEQRKPEVCASG